jgi:hypothetical protein
LIAQKHLLRNKLPVNTPVENELSTKIKSHLDVTYWILCKEWNCQHHLINDFVRGDENVARNCGKNELG